VEKSEGNRPLGKTMRGWDGNIKIDLKEVEWGRQLDWFLVNDQRDAQIFSMYLLLFITLYMFRAHRAHHQERQIVSIQPLVTVTLCWWPRCVQVGRSLLPTCTHLGHQHRMTVTRGCIDKICLSWWWARRARNM